MKKIRIGLLAVSLLLTGCGSSDEEKIDKNTGKEQLIVAMDCESAPYSYTVDAQNDHTVAFGKSSLASGFDVLIARDIAKTLNKELVIKKMSSDQFLQALEDGEVDMVMNAIVKDDDESMTYSSPYYTSDISIVVRKDDPTVQYTDIKQFKKVKMSAQNGTTGDRVIDQIKSVKHEKAKKNVETLIKSVKSKKTDAIVLEKNIADKLVHQNGDLALVQLAEKKGFKTDKEMVIGFKEGSEDEDVYKAVQKALKKIKAETKEAYMNTASQASPAWIIIMEENK